MGDYTTLPKVKDRLVDLQGDTTYDVILGDYITSCSREVDRITGSFFDLQIGIVRQFDGDGSRTILLPSPGFNAVTQLRVKVGGTAGTFTVVASSDYFLEPGTRRAGYPAQWLELSDAPSGSVIIFDAGKRTVEVTGDQGWAMTPPEISQVVLNEVVQAWRERGGNRDASGDVSGFGPAGGNWLFSRRSLSVLESYGYRAPWFA